MTGAIAALSAMGGSDSILAGDAAGIQIGYADRTIIAVTGAIGSIQGKDPSERDIVAMYEDTSGGSEHFVYAIDGNNTGDQFDGLAINGYTFVRTSAVVAAGTYNALADATYWTWTGLLANLVTGTHYTWTITA